MNQPASSSLIAVALLLASATLASAQQGTPEDPIYVDTGRDFRQTDHVTMGASLLTPDEENRFATLLQQATTRADMDRIEAEQSALLNQRVAERVNAALNRPINLDSQPAPAGGPARSGQ